MRELTIKLYSFHELGEPAKNRAIEMQKQWMLSDLSPRTITQLYGDLGDLTPEEAYEMEYNDIQLDDTRAIEEIEANEHLFFADGSLVWSCSYTAGSKRGLTEIKIHGELFTIQEGKTR